MFLSRTKPRFAIRPGKNRVTNIFFMSKNYEGILCWQFLHIWCRYYVIKVSSLHGFLKWGIYLSCGRILSDILTPSQNFQLVDIPLMWWVYPSKLRYLCDRNFEKVWWYYWRSFWLFNSIALESHLDIYRACPCLVVEPQWKGALDFWNSNSKFVPTCDSPCQFLFV